MAFYLFSYLQSVIQDPLSPNYSAPPYGVQWYYNTESPKAVLLKKTFSNETFRVDPLWSFILTE